MVLFFSIHSRAGPYAAGIRFFAFPRGKSGSHFLPVNQIPGNGSRYMRLENGLHADVYALEIIIPIAFRLNTYCTHVFRRWLVEKALAKEKQQAYVMLIHKANGYC